MKFLVLPWRLIRDCPMHEFWRRTLDSDFCPLQDQPQHRANHGFQRHNKWMTANIAPGLSISARAPDQ
jgi:hypothetical protein